MPKDRSSKSGDAAKEEMIQPSPVSIPPARHILFGPNFSMALPANSIVMEKAAKNIENGISAWFSLMRKPSTLKNSFTG